MLIYAHPPPHHVRGRAAAWVVCGHPTDHAEDVLMVHVAVLSAWICRDPGLSFYVVSWPAFGTHELDLIKQLDPRQCSTVCYLHFTVCKVDIGRDPASDSADCALAKCAIFSWPATVAVLLFGALQEMSELAERPSANERAWLEPSAGSFSLSGRALGITDLGRAPGSLRRRIVSYLFIMVYHEALELRRPSVLNGLERKTEQKGAGRAYGLPCLKCLFSRCSCIGF
eukprot:1159085-Pelagomonas_calceolata.AAC.4